MRMYEKWLLALTMKFLKCRCFLKFFSSKTIRRFMYRYVPVIVLDI
jgi:hypothetical protein